MADAKISALPSASTPLAGTELAVVVQGGVTKQVSLSALRAPPAGSNGQLQFNNAGAFGAVSGSSVSGSNVSFGGTVTLGGTLKVNAHASYDIGEAGAMLANGFFAGSVFAGIFHSNSDQYGGLYMGSADDAVIRRDAANTIAQRNGTNPQAFRIYNTYTDGANYERLSIYGNGSIFAIASDSAGSGLARDLYLGSLGGGSTWLMAYGSNRWGLDGATSTLKPASDGSYDLGSSSFRVRNGQFSSTLYSGAVMSGSSHGNTATTYAEITAFGSGQIAAYTSSTTTSGSPIGGSLYLGDSAFYNGTFYNRSPGLSAVFNATQNVAADLAFYSYFGGARTERMRILDDGHVGIGTASPSAPLHVNGTSILAGSVTLGGTLKVNAHASYDIGEAGAMLANGFFAGSVFAGIFHSNSDQYGGLYMGSADDAVIRRDGANAVAQRNGTSPQLFSVYNTFTDGANYERLTARWQSNQVFIATESAGTGLARDLVLDGKANLYLSAAAGYQWKLVAGGALQPNGDNLFDLGTSGDRVRDGWFAGKVTVGGELRYGYVTKAGAFTTSDVAAGQVIVGYDSVGGTRKLYMNQGGTLFSVALT